jgi:DNA (cytosine-5)-methyltransferase 1
VSVLNNDPRRTHGKLPANPQNAMQLELLRSENRRKKPARASADHRQDAPKAPPPRGKAPFLEFFAGSGLVAEALRPHFRAAWANDFCEKKAAVYRANHPASPFHLASIENVTGADLPLATLAWASFPCQDLSLAGLAAGIHGQRSGLVWEWLRVIDEMATPCPVLVAENVVGLVSGAGGAHYRALHAALVARGYRVGALMLDAVRWVPQSRPRIFVVAVAKNAPVPARLIDTRPNWAHSQAVIAAMRDQIDAVWWKLPEPLARQTTLEDLIDWRAPCDPAHVAGAKLALIPERHRNLLNAKTRHVAPGYRRTRETGQMLELRFDGVAGCLRTPKGGSSRQVLVLKEGNDTRIRLLTIRETARLMGAPEGYKLPGTYNEGYRAMGDGVAVPVASYLAKHLLRALVKAAARRWPRG